MEEQIDNLVRDDSGEVAYVSREAQSADYCEMQAWVDKSCSRNWRYSDVVAVVVDVDRQDCNCHTCWNHCVVVHAAADIRQNLFLERTASSESHPDVVDPVRSYHGEHPPGAGQTAEHPSMAHPIPLAI